MSVTINKINDFVTSLDAQGLELLKNQLAYSEVSGDTGRGANSKTTFSVEEALFWEAMIEALTVSGHSWEGRSESLISNAGKTKKTRQHFTACSTGLFDYVSHACAGKLDRSRRRAIYVEVFTCLIKWMHARNWNEDYLNPNAILEQIGVVPQAVNRCYPGYAQSRMLHLIVPRAADQGKLRV